MKTTKSWHFLIESQSNDEPTRYRPISRDPTNADRSLQLFPPHILALCNVWQHLNTCASQVMQVYVSHRIALNRPRLKSLAHISLNANCLFTSGCLLLFTINYVFMPQKTLFMHCANMSYMYHCLRYSYYQQKLVTLRSVQGVY